VILFGPACLALATSPAEIVEIRIGKVSKLEGIVLKYEEFPPYQFLKVRVYSKMLQYPLPVLFEETERH